MSDAELIQFATDFREGILNGESSAYMCAAVCWPLAGLLRYDGFPCETEESDLGICNHIYIRLPDGRVLDPTADQFNWCSVEQLPPVYLGEPKPIHSNSTP